VIRPLRSAPRRILAIDPYSRGFGFVVLEGATRLVDWGLKDTRRGTTEATLAKVGRLLDLYRPDLVAVEDWRAARSRRGERARDLLRDIATFAAGRGVATRAIAASQVKAAFAREGVTTKHAIAGVIAARFPELSRYRPRFRKPWMSEDERQAIFDAAALALAYCRASVESRRAGSRRRRSGRKSHATMSGGSRLG
jgi:hypothetical protein